MLTDSHAAGNEKRSGLRQDLSAAPPLLRLFFYSALVLLGAGFIAGLGQSIRVLGAPPMNVDATLLGRALFANGELANGVREFEMAALLDPVGYSRLPEIAYPMPQDPMAAKRLGEGRRRVHQNSNDAAAYLVLGEAQLSTGDYRAGIESLKRACALEPQNASAFALLGQGRLLSGQPNLAEQALRESLALRPDRPEVVEDLAIALYQQSKLDEAADAFERAAGLRGKAVRAGAESLTP